MEPDANLVIVYLYKALVLLIGFGCVVLGVWLATRGVESPVGDIEASAGKTFSIKMVRPTAAAVLIVAGIVVIVFAVTRPFSFSSQAPLPESTRTASPADPAGLESAGKNTDPGSDPSEEIVLGDTASTPSGSAIPGGVVITDTAPVPSSTTGNPGGIRLTDTAPAPSSLLKPPGSVVIADTVALTVPQQP